jgi:predicted enzyme related to lactoylglutathione lyase
MPNQQGGFIWYELITPDPEAAKAFYDKVVGWNVEPPTQDGHDYRHIRASDGRQVGGMIGLTEEMREHGVRPVWLGYVAVEDVDRAVAAMVEDGAQVWKAAWDIPDVGRIALLADPQGAPFYVMTPSPPAGRENEASGAFSPDEAQHVRWNELATSDPDAAIAFYGRHFGWGQEGDMDMGEMGKYRFIQHGSITIGAVMPKMPQMPVSLWTYYVGVDHIDRAADAVTSGGGTILNGPMEIPGGEFALNAMDPQGAPFGLVGPRKP